VTRRRRLFTAAGRLALRFLTKPNEEDSMTEHHSAPGGDPDGPPTQPYDFEDFDELHPDPQHEQPPVESSDDPADTAPGDGTADPGDLPAQIPDVPEDTQFPPPDKDTAPPPD